MKVSRVKKMERERENNYVRERRNYYGETREREGGMVFVREERNRCRRR